MDTPYRSHTPEGAATGLPRGFHGTAKVLRSTAGRLPRTSKARDVVDGAANMFDRAATYVRDRTAADMVEDVRSHAKDNPVAFLVAALAAGVVAGWMLRRR